MPLGILLRAAGVHWQVRQGKHQGMAPPTARRGPGPSITGAPDGTYEYLPGLMTPGRARVNNPS